MKAPESAYLSKNGILITLVFRAGSTLIKCYVARYLYGANSAGGYSTTDADMKKNVMSLFHLDHLIDVRENGAVKGFIGCVKESSGLYSNIMFHNLETRDSGVRIRQGSTIYRVLNDAGLNARPRCGFEIVSTAANWVVAKVSYISAFYVPITSGNWHISINADTTSNPQRSAGSVGFVAARESRTIYATLMHNTPTSGSDGVAPTLDDDESWMEGYKEGLNLYVVAKADSEEGTIGEQIETNDGTVTTRRVLCPQRYFRSFGTTEPTSWSDVSGADVGYGMYEDDFFRMFSLSLGTSSDGNTATSTGIYVYKQDGYPVFTETLPEGWYGESIYGNKAFWVGPGGFIARTTTLQDVVYIPDFSISVTFCKDRTANASYPRYAVVFEFRYTGKTYSQVRATIQGQAESEVYGQTYAWLGIEIYKDSAATSRITAITNIPARYMATTLKITGTGSDTYTYGGIYKSESAAYADSGAYYIDVQSKNTSTIDETTLYSKINTDYLTIEGMNASGDWVTIPFSSVTVAVNKFEMNRTPTINESLA